VYGSSSRERYDQFQDRENVAWLKEANGKRQTLASLTKCEQQLTSKTPSLRAFRKLMSTLLYINHTLTGQGQVKQRNVEHNKTLNMSFDSNKIYAQNVKQIDMYARTIH